MKEFSNFIDNLLEYYMSSQQANVGDSKHKWFNEIFLTPDKIKLLDGVTFYSNETAASYGYTNTKQHVGVLAQQVQEVLPQVVVPAPFDIGTNEDGTEYSLSGENYMTVQYDKLIPLLIEAIKELNEKVDSLGEK